MKRDVNMALPLAALVAALSLVACHAKATATATPPPAAAPKVKVTTADVVDKKVPKLLRLTGVLSSNERTDLAANASGRVVRTFVERGDHVKKGDLLAQLDARAAALSSAEAAANVASAEEQLRAQRTDCDRYAKLLARGAITQQEFDKQSSTCQTQASSEAAAKARAAAAGQSVSDASIRAPFSGLIAERFAHVGDYVHPDTRVVTLLVDDPLRLELTVPEAFVSAVRVGLAVSFHGVAVPGRTFPATIRYMGGEIREATRDLVVEAVTDNGDHALLPGMFVDVDVPIGDVTSPVVPKASLVKRDDGTSLFVATSGHLEERAVQTGSEVDGLVAIVDGVKTGEKVVVSPPDTAVDGAETE